MHWRKVTAGERGGTLAELCERIAALPEGQLWRHNVSGDLPGQDDRIDFDGLYALIGANMGKRGFTYTHYPMDNIHNQMAVGEANELEFTINLSANNVAHADTLADLDIAPVVTLLPADQLENFKTPAGRDVVVCPAITRDDVTCKSCKMCAKADRKTIIGFPAHGASKRKAENASKLF